MKRNQKILKAVFVVALLAGCSAEVTVPENGNPQPQNLSGPVSGQFKGRGWTMVSGEAWTMPTSEGTKISVELWENSSRTPCDLFSGSHAEDSNVLIIVKSQVGETKHDFGASQGTFSWTYKEGEGQTYHMGTSGSSYVDEITADTVKGHVGVEGGSGFSAYGTYSVKLCS